MDNALILMAKYPKIGNVKTRLAKETSNKIALACYKQFIQWHIDTFTNSNNHQFIVYLDQEINLFKKTYGLDLHIKKQTGISLGERLLNSAKEELAHFKNILFIGADCLLLRPDIIQTAFDKLIENDIVIGPSTDGGYYLIGLSNFSHAEIVFNNIAWSTSSVLSETLTNAKLNHLNVFQLESLFDIDEKKDLLHFIKQSEGGKLCQTLKLVLSAEQGSTHY